MAHSLARALVRRRRLLLWLTLAVSLVAALGALRLRVDFSSAAFYGGDDARHASMARLVEAFGPDDDVVVVVVESNDGRANLAGLLDAVRDVSAAVHDLEIVRDVRSIETELSRRGVSADRLGAWLLTSPAVPALVDEAGTAAAVLVRLDRSTDDLARALPAVRAVERAARDAARAHAVHVDLAGVPAVRAAFFDRVVADQLRFGPATFGLIALGLALAFGRLHAVVVGLAAAALPTLWLAGALGWAGVPIGLLNQIDFTLVPVLSVAATLHVLLRIHEEPPERSAAERVAAGTTAIARPVVLSVSTTAVGFASLGAAEMPVLRSFGLWTAMAMLLVGVVALTVVPAALATTSLSPIRTLTRRTSTDGRAGGSTDHDTSASRRGSSRLARWARVCATRPAAVLACGVAVVAFGIVGATRVEVDNRLGSLIDADHPVSRATRVVDERLGGSLALEVVGGPGDEDLQALTRVASRAREDPRVRVVLGPETSPAKDLTRLTLRTADEGARRFAALSHDVRRWGGDHPGLTLTGTAAIAYAGVDAIADSLRTSLALAVVLVTLMIGAAFRSVRLVAIAWVPNSLPLLLGYGLLGWIGRPFDPVPAAILVLALGIAIDDTVHLLDRARTASAAGADRVDAIVHAADTAGTAVTITTLVVTLGLAVNLLASFPALVLLGGLGSVVLGVAWIADLALVPALYGLVGPAPPR